MNTLGPLTIELPFGHMLQRPISGHERKIFHNGLGGDQSIKWILMPDERTDSSSIGRARICGTVIANG